MTDPLSSQPDDGRPLSGVVHSPQPDAGFLRLSGEDRLDFLQRQSSNDLHQLAPDRAVVTVLTSATARILDVLWVLEDEGALGVVTLPGRSTQTTSYLKGKIFFMDQVEVEELSGEMAQADLDGSEVQTWLSEQGFEPRDEPGEVLSGEVAGIAARMVRRTGLSGVGYRALAPGVTMEELSAALTRAGAPALDPDARETLRVEAGLPAADHELTEAYTPLEVGLAEAVSSTKGCYTGQEVLARQITYDKVTRQLVGLRVADPVDEGTRLWAEGRAVGEITSSARSSRLGPIALGVVRRPHHAPGTALVAGEEEDGGSPAEVVPLPFPP